MTADPDLLPQRGANPLEHDCLIGIVGVALCNMGASKGRHRDSIGLQVGEIDRALGCVSFCGEPTFTGYIDYRGNIT